MARILVIDDDKLSRMLISKILDKAGHKVTEAENGREGVDLYRQEPYDILVTDIFMPEQDGITTILQLKREYPNIKIIAISGGGSMLQSNDYLAHAEDFGALRAFTKPINDKQLTQAIQEILD